MFGQPMVARHRQGGNDSGSTMNAARPKTLRRIDTLTSVLFFLPNLIGVAAFVIFPVIASCMLAFCHWRGSRLELDVIGWAGLSNFRRLLGFATEAGPAQQMLGYLGVLALIILAVLVARFRPGAGRWFKTAATVGLLLLAVGLVHYWRRVIRPEMSDPLFWQAFWNSLVLMFWGCAGRVVLCLGMALLLNQRLRDIVIYRTIYFLPTVSSAIALYILWQALYHPDVGVINRGIIGARDGFNSFVAFLGGPAALITAQPPNWLGNPLTSKPAFILMGWWHQAGGLIMLLYLAALQGIPETLYEAADIDGAGPWHKFWQITWPMISPTTFFVLVMGVIQGFQGGFQQAYIMTRGGPAGSTTTLDYFIYNTAFFQKQEMGYASAAAWVLFMVILGLTIINWRYGQRRVHY